MNSRLNYLFGFNRCIQPEEKFSKHLTYNRMELFTPADIVQHSFIVMNSISPLNLELCKNYRVGHCPWSREYYPSFSYWEGIIDTKEKCRKIHGNRELLYNLHLDMPQAKDSIPLLNLSQHVLSFDAFRGIYTSSIPIVEVYIRFAFFANKIFQFVEYACKKNYNKLKILAWLMKFDAINPTEFHQMPQSTVNCIADCMYPGVSDAEFAFKCLMKVNFINWIRFNDKPERLANVLYQVHRVGRKPEIMLWCNNMMVQCFFDDSLKYLKVVMKFLDTPKFCDYFKQLLTSKIRFECSRDRPNWRFTNFRTPVEKREILLLLLLWFRVLRFRIGLAAAEAVRLVWESVPDTFLNNEEMTAAYERFSISPEEIAKIYKFYCRAVGKVDSTVEPRSLQHYCRTTVRRILYENNQWLPEGICQIDLPPKLQRYLNLEK
ncbi:uncharacterized protein LOC129987490 [Argiope bruennichi]|uniref:SOCS box domain-containing protein n=1 Tax=Argiope bruennichi TaxID=94029 RepID=A0A8T0EC39_ARGBR|nr:uncharacterized protein LOC129987490 [Argiope bruennichi]KAF8770371.1 hypothetical protein HNY73_017912 [Argiope bruennichi]